MATGNRRSRDADFRSNQMTDLLIVLVQVLYEKCVVRHLWTAVTVNDWTIE